MHACNLSGICRFFAPIALEEVGSPKKKNEEQRREITELQELLGIKDAEATYYQRVAYDVARILGTLHTDGATGKIPEVGTCYAPSDKVQERVKVLVRAISEEYKVMVQR